MLKAIEKAGLEIQLTSLTEVLILIVFVLLLTISDEQVRLDKYQASVVELENQIKQKDDEIAKLKREKQNLKSDLDAAARTIAILKRFMNVQSDEKDVSDQALIRFVRNLVDIQKTIGQGGIDIVIDDKNKTIEELRNRLAAANREIERLQKIIGKPGGTGYPNCWIEGIRREYLQIATVELMPNGYRVSGEWEPITEDEKISTVPGLMQFSSGFLTPSEFRRAASAVFNWSQKQAPECRFRVNVLNNEDSFPSASDYRKRLKLVIDHFYQKPLD